MTSKFISWVLGLFTLAAISGCASMSRGEPSAETGNKSNGVVATSVTFTKGHTLNAWFYVRKKGVTDKSDSVRLDAATLSSGGTATGWLIGAVTGKGPDFPDMPNRTGRVLAVSLAPGEYELFTWELYVQLFGGYGYIKPTNPPKPLSFEVKAGEVTYLGNLHLELLMGKNVLGLQVPAGGAPVITNLFERDTALLKSKFTMLQDWPIQDAHLDGAAWLDSKTGQ